MNKTKTLLLALSLIGAFILGNTVIAELFKPYITPTTGTTEIELNVTWDTNSSAVTQIEWGLVTNGEPTTLPELINIENTGSTPTTLAISTTDWSTSIVDLTLTWDYDDTPLDAGATVTVTLTQTITVSGGDFTYNTVFSATQT